MKILETINNVRKNNHKIKVSPFLVDKFVEFLVSLGVSYSRSVESDGIYFLFTSESDEITEVIDDWLEMGNSIECNHDDLLETLRVLATATVKSWGANSLESYGINIFTRKRGESEEVVLTCSELDFDLVSTLCEILNNELKDNSYSSFEPETTSLWIARRWRGES